MAQILPANESFASPDWTEKDTGTDESPPWYYYYIGFSPTKHLPASTGAADEYPLLIGGDAPCIGTSALLTPGPRANTALNCVMTDPNGSFLPDVPLRAVLCREEDTFNISRVDLKVTFGIEVAGGAGVGFAYGGSSGSSPSPGGGFPFPQSPTTHPTTLPFHSTMGDPHGGTWTAGGGLSAQGDGDSPMNPWPAWRGNALFLRAGAGLPIAVNGATESPFTDAEDVKRLWYYGCVDHYAFIVYPSSMGGSATAPDLWMELWRVHYTNAGGPVGNDERMLIRQRVSTGTSKIDFRQPFHLRCLIANSGGNVAFTAYIGKYTDSTGTVQDEVQCFKDGVFPDDYYDVAASGVTHTSSTGVVLDTDATAGTGKITATADKTIGFATATDANVDVSAELGATTPVFWAVHTGLYSVEVKDSSGDIVYRDEFERLVEGTGRSGLNTVVNNLVTMTGIQGAQANGMFTFDAYAKQFPVTLSTATNNLNMVRPSLNWTDGPADSGEPNDYVNLDYDYDDGNANRPYNVMRSGIYLRPSTQLYNHHRSITFIAGSEGAEGLTVNYEVGILLRGYFDGYNIYGLCCYLTWTTNNQQAISAASLVLAYRNCLYSDNNLDLSTTKNIIIARKNWGACTETEYNGTTSAICTAAGGTWTGPLGDIPGEGGDDNFPDIYDSEGSGAAFPAITLDFECQTYDQATSPVAPGLYKVKLSSSGGTDPITTPIYLEFDSQTAPYQSATTTPFTVTEPEPIVASGRSEGFWFLCDQPETWPDGSGGTDRIYDPFKFSAWTETAPTADPGGFTDADSQASIAVGGEGTPTGSLNVTGGALDIAGGGVWDVETEVDVQFFYPIRKMQFDSGHTYGSPINSANRRRWRVRIKGMDLSVYQSLQSFYNDHNGMEVPFTFKVPIPDDGTETGSTAEAIETVYGWFADDSLVVDEVTYQTYDVAFSVEELLVQ